MRRIAWSEYISRQSRRRARRVVDPVLQRRPRAVQERRATRRRRPAVGRSTYEGFAAAWPEVEKVEGDFAIRMNTLPKYVASTTLETADSNNSTIIRDNVPEPVAKLNQAPGQSILIGGSGALAKSLLPHA